MQEMTRQSSYAYEQANFLSNIGPRLSGSSQAATAVAYVAQQMRELGLDVRLEPVTVRHWVRGREEAELVLIGERPKGPARRFWSQLSEIPSPRPIKDFDCS